jgi:hypothetical protein
VFSCRVVARTRVGDARMFASGCSRAPSGLSGINSSDNPEPTVVTRGAFRTRVLRAHRARNARLPLKFTM